MAKAGGSSGRQSRAGDQNSTQQAKAVEIGVEIKRRKAKINVHP